MKEPQRLKENIPERKLTHEELRAKADSLAQSFIIVDTHIDVPYRLNQKWEEISERTKSGEFDYPRAKEGGLNAAFMSIYTPARLEGTGRSKEMADKLISDVQKIVNKHPDKFALAYSVADVTNQFKSGVISFPLGMENGSPVEGKIENLKYFFDKGIRYITLAHGKSNHISDSSYDPERKWNGLSFFGEEVVREMNRLGIMVDVSHISDGSFYDVINTTEAPVIASHSSCRYFTPGFERNKSDEMIKALAENGGVIQINFGSSFLSDEIRKKADMNKILIADHISKNKLEGDEGREFRRKFLSENQPGYADVKNVVRHIDHVVKLVGIDYVGIGSDFDGLGDSLPSGLKDVSAYPNLLYELLKAGYSDADIKKICSGNILRVWSDVEQYAKNY
jgi:membrane dipeptidase